MASVTQRIKSVQQPYGGYLPIKHFSKRILEDGNTLNENENISAGLVGMAVDYLTRFMLGSTADQAFHISTLGAKLIGMQHMATELKAQVTGLDNASITAACKLAGFDVCYRASVSGYRPVENITPDQATIENIRIMVNRSMSFWNQYGPVVCSEPTFEGGYSAIIVAGDGDYVTQDTLWDFKVTKTAPTSKHTLQILVYYIMGMHSIHSYYKSITQLGFFNPRLNTVYTCSVADISQETIKEVEEQVIGYGQPILPPIQHSTITQQSVPGESDYSVADICAMTGLSKNSVYSEIRSGRLVAYKKSNKYMISRDEYNRYLAYLDEQRKLKTTLVLAMGAVGVLFLIVVLIFLSL